MSESLRHRVGRGAGRATRARAGSLLLGLLLATPAAAELPSAAELLDEAGFPAEDKQKVLGGEFVSMTLKSTSDRELAIGLAFVVDVPPSALSEDARQRLLVTGDPNTIAFGKIQGDGQSDFGGLTLRPEPEKRARVYLDARPGQDLNLDTAEFSAFRALGGKGSTQQVEALVRKTLLGRYQAYLASGLDGIAPYDRGDGKETPAGGDLRRASEAARLVEKYAPSFYAVLLGYPKSVPPGLEQRFDWTNYEAHGTPTFILTHRLAMPDGDAYVVAQRQFYVSRGYNTEQALAAFLPVKQGSLVLYANRTSTDQVTGFGGSSKRAIGSRVMASQLEDLFTKVRADAAKRGSASSR